MAETQNHTPSACSRALTRAFGFLGKKWNGVLLATLIDKPASFSELKKSVAGISDSVLSERLTELAKAGLVTRTVSEGPPVSVTYGLTEAGMAIVPAIAALGDWADKNLPEEQCTLEEK